MFRIFFRDPTHPSTRAHKITIVGINSTSQLCEKESIYTFIYIIYIYTKIKSLSLYTYTVRFSLPLSPLLSLSLSLQRCLPLQLSVHARVASSMLPSCAYPAITAVRHASHSALQKGTSKALLVPFKEHRTWHSCPREWERAATDADRVRETELLPDSQTQSKRELLSSGRTQRERERVKMHKKGGGGSGMCLACAGNMPLPTPLFLSLYFQTLPPRN